MKDKVRCELYKLTMFEGEDGIGKRNVTIDSSGNEKGEGSNNRDG